MMNTDPRRCFAENLGEGIRRSGKSRRQLSRETGIPEGTLSCYVTGRRFPRPEQLRLLAGALGMRLGELTGMEPEGGDAPGLRLSEGALRVGRTYDRLDGHGRRMLELVAQAEEERVDSLRREAEEKILPLRKIRHYLTPAAAGYASPIEGEDYEDVAAGAEVPEQADFCIDIAGDSMEPYIGDGQRVYVQRGASLKMFDVGIFFVDGDVFCKQWCVDHLGTLYLLSANPRREDANIVIPRDAGRSVVCFGKVLLSHRLPRPVYR